MRVIGLQLPAGVPRQVAGVPGARLSNTPSTYPGEGDNLGKLRIIPHRLGVLEGLLAQNRRVSARAPGWDGALSGSWWCNGPPSLRRVRAMGVGARRWALRQGPRPYGAQQARNLGNGRKPDQGTPSAAGLRISGFSPVLKAGGIRGG